MEVDSVTTTALVPKAVAQPDLSSFENLEGLIAAAGSEVPVAGAVGDAEKPDLITQVKALPPDEHESLWRRVLAVAGEYLKSERLLIGNGSEVDETAARAVHATAVLLAAFAEGALDASRNKVLPQAFVEVATLCQEMLLTIPDGQTQALIARALELICTDLFEGREDFFGGVLMFLIGKCLGPKMTGADVTRLYKVRDLLGELDWEHESIESLKMQLMRCTASPNFARSQHGPDMLCLFFTIYPGFTAEVHSTVKNQVMYSRPAVLKSYAVGFFKAWKASEGGTRVQIEHCVQEWATLAIRSARKSADKARAMLEEFHRHRHADEQVNELLCRLYGPILWRCLKVANWQVRENAARLLQYTFALVPSELGVADREQELARQLRLLRETLEDPSEPVRRVGCSAVCIILKTYWDMLPPGESAELLTVLMNKCAQDKKAPMVRAAVAEGFSWILENPLAHPTMQAVLPQVADLMNDRSPIVRAAFVSLLHALHQCKGFAIGNVVKHETLLLRLASEHTEGQAERLQKGLHGSKKPVTDTSAEARASPDLVAKRLARLVAPSLFQDDLPSQVKRCYLILTKYPLALLALLTHAKDTTPVHDRVKLAAALFHFGLRDAASAGGGSGTERPKTVGTMLRVVGVLLEGATEPVKRGKKKASAASSRFPKELEAFVYKNIKEEDFIGLLQVSHEGDIEAARLCDDLLYAVSHLDPAKLPNTAELVRHELMLACRGAGGPTRFAQPRLAALLRTAVRWGLIGSALEPAWERLAAAAARFKQRQPAADDTANAVTVVEAVFRDPDIRGAILPAKADQLKQIVEGVSAAFRSSWTIGLTDIRKPATKSEPMLLGPAAQIWPRVLGLVMRIALHVEHRLAPSAVQPRLAEGSEDASSEQKVMNGDEAVETQSAVMSAQATGVPDSSSPAETLLDQLGQALTCAHAVGALEALEAVAAAKCGDGSQPAKKRAKSLEMPADIDMVLQVHERALEALNANHFLSVLKRSEPSAKDGVTAPVLARNLELCLWRWAYAADTLRPREEGPRLVQTWIVLGRLLLQMAHSDIPTPDVIEALVRLLRRVSDEVPTDDNNLRKLLQALFQRMEFEPQLVQTLAAMIGQSADGVCGGLSEGAAESAASAEAPADQDAPSSVVEKQVPIEVHPRVRAILMELIPGFRNLRAKLMLKDAEPQPPHTLQSPGQDRRRILASPTPQKVARGQEMPGMVSFPDIDGESVSEPASQRSDGRHSLGHRSFSVRSRSPPPPMPDVTDGLEDEDACQGSLADPEAASMRSEPADPASPVCVDVD